MISVMQSLHSIDLQVAHFIMMKIPFTQHDLLMLVQAKDDAEQWMHSPNCLEVVICVDQHLFCSLG
jgi:hypothetical protein